MDERGEKGRGKKERRGGREEGVRFIGITSCKVVSSVDVCGDEQSGARARSKIRKRRSRK